MSVIVWPIMLIPFSVSHFSGVVLTAATVQLIDQILLYVAPGLDEKDTNVYFLDNLQFAVTFN